MQTVFCRVILVDGHAMLFRFHYAYGGALKTSTGENTSIAYGFIKQIVRLLMDIDPSPTHMAVVFDAPGKTFRLLLCLPSFAALLCGCDVRKRLQIESHGFGRMISENQRPKGLGSNNRIWDAWLHVHWAAPWQGLIIFGLPLEEKIAAHF